MRPKSRSLFKLIQKMTPNEKRYFKRIDFSNNKNTNQYMLLFDAINQQKEYDEAALLKQFEGYSFTNNFSEIKKYLYQQIKKSLRLYHAKSSVNITLNNALSDLEILYNKELYEDCLQLIKKTQKLALQYERNHVLLLLNTWRLKLVGISHSSDGVIDYLENNVAADQEYIKGIQSNATYSNYIFQILLETRKNDNNIQKEIPQEILKTPPQSFIGKCKYLNLHALLNINNPIVSIEYDIKEIELYEANPHFIKDNPQKYIIALSNTMSACAHNNQVELFETYFHKSMDALDKYHLDPSFKLREIINNYMCSLDLQSQKGQKEKIIESMTHLLHYYELAEKQELFRDNSLKLLVFFSLLNAYITLGDFEKGLDYCNLISSIETKNHQEALFWDVRLIRIMLHFHFQNWTLLESLLRSSLRISKLHFSFDKTAKYFIETIKKCTQIRASQHLDEQQTQELLKKYLEECPLPKNISTKHLLYNWIKAILEKKTILEVIQPT